MDRKLPAIPEIQRLIQLSAAARSCLSREATVLRSRVDLAARLRSSLNHHPLTWCFSSLASGLAASFMWRRKIPLEKKRRAIPATLLGLTLSAARPLVNAWLGKQLKHWLARQTFSPPSGRRNCRATPTSNSI